MIGQTLSWVQLFSPLSSVLSLAIKPFNMSAVTYKEFLYDGTRRKDKWVCLWWAPSIFIIIFLVGTFIMTWSTFEKGDSRPYWAREFDIILYNATDTCVWYC